MSECPEETKISSVSRGKQRIIRELQVAQCPHGIGKAKDWEGTNNKGESTEG